MLSLLLAVSLHLNCTLHRPGLVSDLPHEQNTVLSTVAAYKEVEDKAACEKCRVWLGRKHKLCTIKRERFNDNSKQEQRKENKAVPDCEMIYLGKNCLGNLKYGDIIFN